MKYLQRLSDCLIHKATLAYLLHDQKRISQDIEYEVWKALKIGASFRIKKMCVYSHYNNILNIIEMFKNISNSRVAMFDVLIYYGKYKLIKWIDRFMKYYGADLTDILSLGNLMIVAADGHPMCMKLLHERHIPKNEYQIPSYLEKCSAQLKILRDWKKPSYYIPYINSLRGHSECLKLLLEWDVLPDECPLFASMFGHTKCIELLYERKKYNLEQARKIINWSARNGYIGSIKILYKIFNKSVISDMTIISASEGYPKTMKLLHKLGAPINVEEAITNSKHYPKCRKLLRKWGTNTDSKYYPKCSIT